MKPVHIATRGQEENTYDAIVVGSGISGGWAAKELCEKGLKTLVLERGRDVKHVQDYTTATKHPWEFDHRGRATQVEKEEHYVQSKCYAFDETTKHFFVNDREHPYLEAKPFNWIRGYQVGGRSLIWGRQCYRWSKLDFEANARDGFGVDWPIRYDELAPWYTYVEQFVGVSGSTEGIDAVPDGSFLPAMEMNCLEKHMAARLKEKFNDRHMIIGRAAHLTQPHLGRGVCQFRNLCYRGCPFGGYFSSNSATLPAAAKTGNLTLRPHAIVSEVLYDKNKKRATGVRIIDQETRETTEYFAKIIFLNASTLGTTFILLNSISEAFPYGLGNGSGQVGHNLMDHHYEVGARAISDDFQDQYFTGRRPNGVYIPRFRNTHASSQRNDYVRGFGYQGGAWRGWPETSELLGESLKEGLQTPGPWTMWLGSWGEMLPYYENKVTLNWDALDPYGLPMLEIDCGFRDNEFAMRKDMMACAGEMMEAAGLKNIQTFDNVNSAHPGHCIHEMGTARMGKDPRTSVLNRWNQMHEVPNVFVTDGACMTSSACQNPSITYMALTARACDYAVRELKKRDL
jgi:choline dehydrogenase-like flavoprotein